MMVTECQEVLILRDPGCCVFQIKQRSKTEVASQ